MDIFAYAKEFNADYYDNNGKIYKIQEYNHAKRQGLPIDGIRIVDVITGNTIGYIREK